MEENRICPIMSRPLQGPNNAFKNESDMIEQKWYPINGVAWENVFPCVREKCMAWVPIKYRCQLAWESKCPDEDSEICNLDTCPKCVKVIHEEGYCRIMEGGEEI